jgi:hypothetical protein
VTLFFVKQARDCSETPIHVGLMKLCRGDASIVETGTQLFKRMLVAGRQVDVGRVMVGGATELIGVFNGGVASLNSLLRDWEISAADGVEVGLADLGSHDNLTSY